MLVVITQTVCVYVSALMSLMMGHGISYVCATKELQLLSMHKQWVSVNAHKKTPYNIFEVLASIAYH